MIPSVASSTIANLDELVRAVVARGLDFHARLVPARQGEPATVVPAGMVGYERLDNHGTPRAEVGRGGSTRHATWASWSGQEEERAERDQDEVELSLQPGRREVTDHDVDAIRAGLGPERLDHCR